MILYQLPISVLKLLNKVMLVFLACSEYSARVKYKALNVTAYIPTYFG